MSGSADPEAELLDRVQAGDENAFRLLYRAHADDLYRFGLHLTDGVSDQAEELVQETWVRAVRGLAGFERRSSLRAWLFGIAARCASESRRSAAAEVRRRDGLGREDPPRPSIPSGTVVDLQRALGALPWGFRTVLVLHDVKGLKHREIADILGISIGTSKSQLSRARRSVRQMLGDDYVTT